jgi:hypothetical protein
MDSIPWFIIACSASVPWVYPETRDQTQQPIRNTAMETVCDCPRGLSTVLSGVIAANKKPTASFRLLSASRVFPVNDSARVESLLASAIVGEGRAIEVA